ncbi:hypothetical protein [Ralstonia phage RSP15]|uniref:hypothetical protein n=1 Tax=Ralstonia phage RSP15 TaxID=1785960 RepID=UPI00074D40A6|nr:hypothetical protein BH754_gp103 [Ralstonia phage RSP15]BAU40061.1 hypothetical protein [Ralstonia phage RSP15]
MASNYKAKQGKKTGPIAVRFEKEPYTIRPEQKEASAARRAEQRKNRKKAAS